MITQNIVEINNPRWQERAKCNGADPGIFFKRGSAEAKKFCKDGCPVIKDCLIWILKLEATLEQDPQGVYAGTTPKERRRMKLCVYEGCYKPRIPQNGNAHFRYCSEEHKKAHHKVLARRNKLKKNIRENIDSPTNIREYPVRGRVRNA